MTKYTDHIEIERKEIVQNLIDRLLYLPDTDRVVFLDNLNSLFLNYNIDVEMVDGLRIYKIKRHSSN